jgi:transposase
MDLQREVSRLRAENAELRSQLKLALAALENVAALEARVKELEGQLAQNSENSNWPPSRDKNRKPKRTRSMRQKSDKPAGGQVDHPGRTLQKSMSVDEIEVHRPAVCEHCTHPLGLDAKVPQTERRQVIELPPMKLAVTEHQVQHLHCPACGKVSKGRFPAAVSKAVQFGPNLRALSVYLNQHHLIPMKRLSEIINDWFGTTLSPGSIASWVEQSGMQVKSVVEQIKAALSGSPVLHCDETGLYVEGRRVWLHVHATPQLTLFEPQAKRGKVGIDALGILPNFAGTAVHDNWSAYHTYGCAHALCNAHLLRELLYAHEVDGHPWAEAFKAFLLDLYHQVKTARTQDATALTVEQLAKAEVGYQILIEQALLATAPPSEGWTPSARGRPKKPKARNLAERLDTQRRSILAFAYNFDIPFDNNLVERDIRMVKVQQKISGCFRSWDGAVASFLLRSYLSSMRKQGHSVFSVLRQLFAGQIFLPALAR